MRLFVSELLKNKIEIFFGFHIENISSFTNLVSYMYEGRDPSNLAITRICFGLLMLIDALFERGGLRIVARWGNPQNCHFPLFSQLQAPSLYFMAIVYGIMWIGALGITVGYKFKYSTFMYFITYWYILLLDKSYWNNHSYLFGIVSLLLLGSSANKAFSLDAISNSGSSNVNKKVPLWNYFILRLQFFLLYFMAGLKKIDMEWLGGYSMYNWGHHWVFNPFKIIFTTNEIDYFVIHWFGFLLDLTIGFWLINRQTRPFAMPVCAAFHLMNSQMFTIGMFPYVCLLTMPIFCDDDWPVALWEKLFKKNAIHTKLSTTDNGKLITTITTKQRFVVASLLIHCLIQLFLPYSHFLTKGYNNWTNGLYGYSWDMMVHSWNTALVVVKVVDNETGKELFINPDAWTSNDRWSKHADMCVQYAHCLKRNLSNKKYGDVSSPEAVSSNISIYIDVWCSLNGRFQQRMFDPNYDLLQANWGPFQPVQWLLPLVAKSGEIRNKQKEIEENVYSWSNSSDVMFIADFPGMVLENYLSTDLINVTVSVIEGQIVYEEDINSMQSRGLKLVKNDFYPVTTGMFHKIHTIGPNHSFYMYTYINQTKELIDSQSVLN